jgi:hypothetical protein
MKIFSFTALALTVALVVLATSALGAAGDKTITVKMSGKQETPKGDPDGTGTATVTLKPGSGKVCFKLAWHRIGNPTASHIHQGKKGVAGPVVIPFFGGTPKHSACVSASKTLIRKIIKSPASYYVNIHNAKYPAGALRGQL